MNLLLNPDHEFCQEVLAALGTAASLASVDDQGYSLVAINDLGRTYFGLSPIDGITKLNLENMQRLTGSTLRSTEAYLARLHSNYKRVVDSGMQQITETDYLTAEGETRWSRNVLTPIMQAGCVVRLFVTFLDMTELKTTQHTLEKSLSSLVGGLVHYCDSCQKVESEDGQWQTITQYMSSVSPERMFSHGMCPACADKFQLDDDP